MNYKEIFALTWGIISNPVATWKKINADNRYLDVQPNYVYPYIGLASLATFIGILLSDDTNEVNSLLTYVMRECSVTAVALLAGFFITSYSVEKIFVGSDNIKRIMMYVGYSYSVVYVLMVVSEVFPSLSFIMWILQFYTIYVAWEGSKAVINVKEEKRLLYTLTTSLLIILSPTIVEMILKKLMQII